MKSNEKFIPEYIISALRNNGFDSILDLPNGQFSTISEVIEYCKQKASNSNQDTSLIDDIVYNALSNGYYSRYIQSDNARAIDQVSFTSHFNSILQDFGILSSFDNLNVIVVGVGNGSECDLLFSQVKNLFIVDISSDLLENAKEIMPCAKTYCASAESLNNLPDNFFDIYISLRTFQSTYFDIHRSLKEANRIIKKNGCILLSIACGYLKGKQIHHGLYNPHSSILERNRPEQYVSYITSELRSLCYHKVKTLNTDTEIFIYSKKDWLS